MFAYLYGEPSHLGGEEEGEDLIFMYNRSCLHLCGEPSHLGGEEHGEDLIHHWQHPRGEAVGVEVGHWG